MNTNEGKLGENHKLIENHESNRKSHDLTGNHDLNKENDDSLHQKFSEYGGNVKMWQRKCIFLLPKIYRRRIWQKKGFGSIYEYAAKLAGMSRSQVDNALWILRKIEDKPALRKVAKEKGINAIKPIVAIATVENEKFLAAKANIMSRNTLETYARGIREGRLTNEEGDSEKIDRVKVQVKANFEQNFLPGEKQKIIMKLDLEIAAKLEKLNGQGDWNDLMKQFLKMREDQLEAEKPEVVKTNSRPIPVKVSKYVIKKTNGNCIFPGCMRPGTNLHHIKRNALHKEHDPDSIVLLCKAHHRIAHLGLIDNEEGPPETWRLRSEAEWYRSKHDIDKLANQYIKPGG